MGKVEARVRRCLVSALDISWQSLFAAHQVDSAEDLDDLVALHLLPDELCMLDFRREHEVFPLDVVPGDMAVYPLHGFLGLFDLLLTREMPRRLGEEHHADDPQSDEDPLGVHRAQPVERVGLHGYPDQQGVCSKSCADVDLQFG